MDKIPVLFLFWFFVISTSAIHFDGSGLLPGDIIIGGLFSVYYGERNQCQGISETSIQNLEAVKWVFKKLNENNYIPGLNLGLLALPTCRTSSIANNMVFDIVTDIKNRKSGHYYNETTSPYPIIGILGPEFSSTARTTSLIISSLPMNDRLLQIGFSATAAVLDDKLVYPNLFKVIPSDDIQVKVMIALMQKLQWNQIALIFENDTYGVEGSNLLKQAAKLSSICIAFEKTISVIDGVISFQTALSIISDIQQKNIKGVVFFGYSRTANSLLIASKSSPFSEPVQFIFSEGVDLKDTVFKDSTNQILNNGKGSYVVSPTKLEIDEFSTHWKGIFTDMDRFRNESKTNPFLVDVFELYKNCKPDINSPSTGCDPLTSNEMEEKYTQSISVSYAVRAALLIAKVISSIHLDNCRNDQGGMCAAFRTTVYDRKGSLVSKMEDFTVNFQSDFPFNITAFERRELELRFIENQLSYHPSFPLYEVYQYRNCLDKPIDFCLVQVGNYTKNQLEVADSLIKDYSTSTEGTFWPDISRAVCKPGTVCSACIPNDLPGEVYYLDGDFIIVGIVPVYDKDTSNPLQCGSIRVAFGMELVETFSYAVQKINENTGQFSNYFKNKSVGFLVINSCNQPLIVQNKIVSIIEKGILLKNGSRLQVSDKILGFIGGYGSEISIAAADVLSRLGYVQISYGSTAAILSDRTAYPYFLRVATPDDEQSKLLIKIVKHFDSNYIQVVYSSETYGIGGRDSIRKEANFSRVCIKNEIEVEEGVYNKILDLLRVNPFAKLVIVFLRSHIVPDFMRYMNDQMNYGEFMFIGTESWGKNLDVINGNRKLEGSLSLALEMKERTDYTKYLQSLDPLVFTQNPWFNTYFENKYKCYFPSSFDKSQPKSEPCNENLRLATSRDYKQELWTPFAVNAAYALLIGANDALNEMCGFQSKTICADFKRQPKRLVEKIKSVQLNISGMGLESVFDANGDGSVGYRIYNSQIDPNNRQNLQYVEVGSLPLNGRQFEMDMSKITLPVDFTLPSVCPNDVKCNLCFPEKTPGTNSQTNNSAVAGLGAFIGILLLVIAVLILVLVYIVRRQRMQRTENNKANVNYLHPIPHGFNAENVEDEHYF